MKAHFLTSPLSPPRKLTTDNKVSGMKITSHTFHKGYYILVSSLTILKDGRLSNASNRNLNYCEDTKEIENYIDKQSTFRLVRISFNNSSHTVRLLSTLKLWTPRIMITISTMHALTFCSSFLQAQTVVDASISPPNSKFSCNFFQECHKHQQKMKSRFCCTIRKKEWLVAVKHT